MMPLCGYTQVPKPLDIATATQEDWLVKDFVHHALAFFFLHELRHIALHHDGIPFEAQHDEELECDRWAANFLLARSDSYAATAAEDAVKVTSKRAMGVALGTAVIAHIQELGLWKAGMQQPPIAERMKKLVSAADLPAADLSWTVACSFLLASLRRRIGKVVLVHSVVSQQPNSRLERSGSTPAAQPGRSAQIPTGRRGILRTSLGTIQAGAPATRGGLDGTAPHPS